MHNRRPLWWPENEPWPHPHPWRGPPWFLLMLVPISFLVGVGFLFGRLGHRLWWLWALVLMGGVFLLRRRRNPRWFPVSGLIEAAGRLAEGDHRARVPPVASGPMSEVVRSFNGMAARLEAASEQRRRWLADIGHELRNPLMVIRGELEAMQDGVHAADSEHLQMLLDETALMSRLLDDLRILSESEAGELKLAIETVEVRALVDETLAPLEEEARRAGKNVQTEIVAGTMEADPLRLREVLTNLLTNALRHARHEVWIRGWPSDGRWTLTVSDDGPGIAPEVAPRIFDRFVKGSDSMGTGLGLSIARDLVLAHGGTIEVESYVDRGTTFKVVL